MKEVFENDTPRDLSKFEGFTNEELKEIIEYLESQEKLRSERCKHQTKEEQIADYEKCEREYERFIENFRRERLLKAK